MNIKDLRATIEFSLKYGEFDVKIFNTHGRKLVFKVSEKNNDKGWVDVPYAASEYILKDFKETEEFKKIELVFNNILNDYGY
jgi:hypothetical protein